MLAVVVVDNFDYFKLRRVDSFSVLRCWSGVSKDIQLIDKILLLQFPKFSVGTSGRPGSACGDAGKRGSKRKPTVVVVVNSSILVVMMVG